MSWRYKAISHDEGWTIVEDFDEGHTDPITVYSDTKDGLLAVLLMMYADIQREIEMEAEQ